MNGTTPNDQLKVERGGQSYLGAMLLVLSIGAPFFVLIRQSGRVVDELLLSEWSAIPPFGTVGVVFVNVVCMFAISWSVAITIRRSLGQATVLNVGCSAIVAGGLSVATLYVGDAIATELIAQASASPRFLLRLLWTFILQVPWCISAVLLLQPPADPRFPGWGADEKSAAWMPALLAAMLLPMTHANHVINGEIHRAEDYVSKQQYQLAWNRLVAVESLAGTQQVLQRQSDELRDELLRQLKSMIRQVNQPLAEDAPVEALIERAAQYFSLNALSDAVIVLEGIQVRRPDALLVLAKIHGERRDWRSAITTLDEAADLIKDDTGPDTAVGQQIYHGLADKLRLAGRYPEAEERLREAGQHFETSRGFFLFELGLHHQMGGRFKKALEYYESAAEVDPRYQRQVAAAIEQLKVNTPVCILRPTKLAVR